jgi:amino acid adenylation domain-containing protein
MVNLLQDLLTESAQARPDKGAARFEGSNLTYAELDVQTSQLGRTLQTVGVQRGDRVGIYLHKSLASVISVFGILKSKGVYVPLDPSAPAKRLAYIARDCDIKVLLTSTKEIENLPGFFDEGTPLQVVILMNEVAKAPVSLPKSLQVIRWDQVRNQDVISVSSDGVSENDLAYILYTSGSTGEPKGVMISHRNIFTFIDWCYETFHMSAEDRVTSHAPLHFDLSTFDIYVTIKAGGTVVVVPESLSVFPVQLADLLQNERITVTYLVPSILSMMVNYGKLREHDFSALRAILFAGEVFPLKYLRALAEAIPHVDYYNLFGPTETNVCTCYKVQPRDLVPERSDPVPIGIACKNIEVFAVNNHGALVTTPGQPGELWVSGPSVARGYWGDPEKTAKSFLRNPLRPQSDEVVYRTGDIVQLDDDKVNWRFIGRLDHMIKSRGYRIELGEIETVLYCHRGVKEAVAVAISDDLVGNRVKAYVVPGEGEKLTVEELEEHCSKRLPRYMMPESIEFRASLPKTSTGKIDRAMLVRR